ncbi:hypothetical protein NC653_002622 [Populus alba x Populus x berolinensis]|uniref:Uncharacterized protein n=1 Tax=Populus alba x Populus x berolinensis TaxID=444605 RepID=A0AAD6RR23_9ROSI|nr:hypothetical protein NC653_002622 [Populus alba x Populus x berolinensis]
MCFMAIESENDVLPLDDEFDLSYDELHDAFESLYNGFKKLGYKYSSLKKIYACLLVEKNALKKKAWIVIDSDKVNQLEEKNKALKKKVDKLNTTLAKFNQGFKIFDIILPSQRCVFNKRGIKYQPKKN